MRSLIGVLSRLAPMMLVSACTLFAPTLVEQGVVRMDVKESEPVSVKHATVYREDGMTVVQGEAAFPPWVAFGHFTGHIDIELDLPNGEVVKKQNVRLIRKRIPKKRGRRAYFISRFALNPSLGTIVHVAYHDGRHEKST